jgi:threonine synthase
MAVATAGSAHSRLSRLECSACGARYDTEQLRGLCEACGEPLLCEYELAADIGWPDSLRERPWSMWRYAELLPLRSPHGAVQLGEVVTPLIELPLCARELGVRSLVIKDEGVLPTGSFKARGAAVGISRLRELGGDDFVMATNGNAGAAWAHYAARAGIRAHIVIPEQAPLVTRQEAQLAGAHVTVVGGTISDAGRVSRTLAADNGWFDAGTFKEPYRLEGKKTLGFEIAEQLEWRLPDVVVYPTGGGVGLLGMWKAWRELRAVHLIDRTPRFIAAQASGCAPVVRAFETGAATCAPWQDAYTHAFGINVPNPLADELILRALRESEGGAIAVSDDVIAAERAHVARLEGMHLCPEGACALAAARSLARSGGLRHDASILIINTGSGLKYPVDTL